MKSESEGIENSRSNLGKGQEPSVPSVSIVIVAYQRKDYLLRALKSAVGQIGMKGSYEVIVVKDFKDEEIDEYIRQNGIRSSAMPPGTVGEYVAKGIELSSGDVVSFLDDDDAFLPEKVAHIQQVFSMDHEACYYHNAYQVRSSDEVVVRSILHPPVLIDLRVASDSNDHGTMERIIAKNLVSVLSCVSVRRLALLKNIEEIRGMQGATDYMMFYVALATKGYLLFDGEQLSIYYIHRNSASRPSISSMNAVDPGLRYARDQMYTYAFGTRLPERAGISRAARALKSQWEWLCLLMSSDFRREVISSYGRFVRNSLPIRPIFVILSTPIGLVSLVSVRLGRRLFHLLRAVNL